MNVIAETADGLPGGLYSLTAAYRHRVFVERLGWQLATQDGMERDQFDRPDTVYVVARGASGNVCGCARLLPTTRPYLLSEVFPQLLNGAPPPSSPEVWELSRFAAVDFNANTTSALGQFSSPVAIRLLEEAISCAAARGARRLITVSPIGVERLLRRAGFHAHRAGPPMILNEQPIFACWIEFKA
jgi:N-acyl-L-homoserine lactone synthetase